MVLCPRWKDLFVLFSPRPVSPSLPLLCMCVWTCILVLVPTSGSWRSSRTVDLIFGTLLNRVTALQARLSLKVTSCVLSLLCAQELVDRTETNLSNICKYSCVDFEDCLLGPIIALFGKPGMYLTLCLFFLTVVFLCARQANVMWFYYTHEDVSPVNLSKTQTNYIWMDMKNYKPEGRNMGGNRLVHSSLLSYIISALY